MFVNSRQSQTSSSDSDSALPPIEVFQFLQSIQEELDREDQICFVWTVAKYALGELSLDEYFDNLVGHLKHNAIRHKFDKRNAKIEQLLEVDLIGGAVKRLMLDQSFPRLSDEDAARMKAVWILAYNNSDPDELARKTQEIDFPLENASPKVLDILAIIAYARRHIAVVERLITYPAPGKSVFDLIGTRILCKRPEPNQAFQHCSDTPDIRILECRLWTALLTSGWIHYPLTDGTEGLYYGLHWLVEYFVRDPEARASPHVEEFLKTLSEKDIILGVSTISRFLSITEGQNFEFPARINPCTATQAKMILSYFPIPAATRGNLQKGDSAEILLPITQWGLENPDRLEVARMLLEQGLDPNGKVDGYGHGLPLILMDTPLHKAAELGDKKMVELLVEFGAKGNILSGIEDTPAQRARTHGHSGVAEILERQS